MKIVVVRYGLLLIVCGIMVGQGARGNEPDKGPDAGTPSKALTVCAIPASMPRTGKAPDGTPQGIDVAVAQALGRVLGRTVEFHWCANPQCSIARRQPDDTSAPMLRDDPSPADRRCA